LGSRDDYELSITIVNDVEIESLNRDYLNRDGPTNVISFPMCDGDFSEISPHLLGDVVISIDTAIREGEHAGIKTDERLSQLLVHGILHLFGYDHDTSPNEEKKMTTKSIELLRLIENNTELDYF